MKDGLEKDIMIPTAPDFLNESSLVTNSGICQSVMSRALYWVCDRVETLGSMGASLGVQPTNEMSHPRRQVGKTSETKPQG